MVEDYVRELLDRTFASIREHNPKIANDVSIASHGLKARQWLIAWLRNGPPPDPNRLRGLEVPLGKGRVTNPLSHR